MITYAVADRTWRKIDVRSPSECWEWRSCFNSGGYGQVEVDGVPNRAHRVTYFVWHGPIPPEAVVMHTCDNRKCCNPLHLRIGTPAQNSADMVEKKRSARGSRHSQARLVESDIPEIRKLYAAGAQTTFIARKFGVDRKTIAAVVHGLTWKHI